MPPNLIQGKTHITYIILLPNTFNLNLIMRKPSDKCKLRDIITNNQAPQDFKGHSRPKKQNTIKELFQRQKRHYN